MRPEISLVVTARNESPPILAETVDGLLATSEGYPRELILIDDASELPVQLERPHLRVVRNQVALGVAPSRRLGASLAQGDVLVWTDAHMHFAPDWLSHMLAHVGSGALLCAAWWNYELSRPVCWGGQFLWCGERDYKLGRSPGLTFRHLQKFPGPGAIDVPMVIGACYMLSRTSCDKIGGFSPFFRVWGKSEQDISARAWILGLGAKCVTGARVGHLSRSSFPYPVKWEDIEFNQAVMVRTVFEDRAIDILEGLMHPLPQRVKTLLDQTDFSQWRSHIQLHRRMSDREFFRRFVPTAPQSLLEDGEQGA